MKPQEFWVLMTSPDQPCLVSKNAHQFDDLLKGNPNWEVVEAETKNAKGEWISVEDRLPEVGKWWLCYSRSYQYILFLDSVNNDGSPFWLGDDGDWEPVVTHWMPLPEPPKGEE